MSKVAWTKKIYNLSLSYNSSTEPVLEWYLIPPFGMGTNLGFIRGIILLTHVGWESVEALDFRNTPRATPPTT